MSMSPLRRFAAAGLVALTMLLAVPQSGFAGGGEPQCLLYVRVCWLWSIPLSGNGT